MTKDRALQEAARSIKDLMHALVEGRMAGDDYMPEELEAFSILDAIEAALAQPEQEPVVEMEALADNDSAYAYADGWNACVRKFKATNPQQRPWVGLTDEDVNSASVAIDARLKLAFHTGMYVAQKILMEKNFD